MGEDLERVVPAKVADLPRARAAFERRAWAESYRLFDIVDRQTPLEPEDLQRAATAAYLGGRDNESDALWTRAHQTLLERGDPAGAAASATWMAVGLMQRGAIAPALGWFGRAERILDEAQLDCVVRGYLLIPTAIHRIIQGDPTAGHALFVQAADIARRFGDHELAAFSCHGRGRALIRLGNVSDGMALLDEAMVAVVSGEVSPMLAGDIYCSVLEACQETFDLRRAYEWTTSLAQWCAGQQDLVRYRGECLLYRAEVMQLRGKWSDAVRDAQDACEALMSRPMAGVAFYRLGEIHRLRGDLEKAEVAYTQANERGRRPQPGLSLLRLAQGHVDAAAASIRSTLLDSQPPATRARILVAAAEILLAAGDLEHARTAASELSEIARRLEVPLLAGASAHATGAVMLAEGDIAGASALLRLAWESWRDLEMPYDEAQACLLMADVCERRGDQDGRRLELDNARRLLELLDAGAALARIGGRANRDARHTPGSLSERELQVLHLMAAGKTNREIAEALFISDKTVARHVSNIFDKLEVSSRAAATAWAYQHNLM